MSTTTEKPEFKILSRVSSLPLVASALGYGYLKYNQIKQANPILDQGLSIAESTVAFAASNAKPVVAKFTPTLLAADGYACEALDKLEERVPAIKSSAPEIYSNAQNTLVGLKDYGVQRIQSVYDTNVAPTVDSAISLTGRAVDLLVADEEETETDKAMKTEKSAVRRFSYMTEKLRKRVLTKVFSNIRSIPTRSADAVKSMYTVDLIQYAKLVDHGKAGANEIMNRVTKFAGDNPTNPIVTLATKATTAVSLNRERLRLTYDSGHRFVSSTFNGLVHHLSDVYSEIRNAPMDQMPATFMKQLGNSAELLGGWLQVHVGKVIPFRWFEFTESCDKSTGTSEPTVNEVNAIHSSSPAKTASESDESTDVSSGEVSY